MQYGIAFTPLVPSIVLWLALGAIAVIAALLLLGRSRGAALRRDVPDLRKCWRALAPARGERCVALL